jgi:hypothetical protein
MVSRAVVIRNIAEALFPDGVLFGSTILGTQDLHTRLSHAALRATNRRRIFDNLTDDLPGLRTLLLTHFETIGINVVGTVAIFNAQIPRRAATPALP